MNPDQTGERDEAWFEDLFRRHGNDVLAYARRRVARYGGDADDVVADVFTTAWLHRQSLPDPALLWLYRAAAHQVMHTRRGHDRRTALAARAATLDPPDRDPLDQVEALAGRLDDGALARAVLHQLPDADAEVLRLWAWEQLSPAEIAYVLGVSGAAARVRLHRARRRAKALLADPTGGSTSRPSAVAHGAVPPFPTHRIGLAPVAALEEQS